jgi:exodeoxyribonuclease VII small subunit
MADQAQQSGPPSGEQAEQQPFPYEEKVQAVRKIIERLESEELPFEESIQLFEQGNALLNECQTFLERAELRVRQLSEGEEGLEAHPFEANE